MERASKFLSQFLTCSGFESLSKSSCKSALNSVAHFELF